MRIGEHTSPVGLNEPTAERREMFGDSGISVNIGEEHPKRSPPSGWKA